MSVETNSWINDLQYYVLVQFWLWGISQSQKLWKVTMYTFWPRDISEEKKNRRKIIKEKRQRRINLLCKSLSYLSREDEQKILHSQFYYGEEELGAVSKLCVSRNGGSGCTKRQQALLIIKHDWNFSLYVISALEWHCSKFQDLPFLRAA